MTVTFEGYERRADKINKCLADNGIASLEEALQICTDKGFNRVRSSTTPSPSPSRTPSGPTPSVALSLSSVAPSPLLRLRHHRRGHPGLHRSRLRRRGPQGRSGPRQPGAMLLSDDTECFAFLAGHESFAAAEGAIGLALNANKARKKPLRVILNGLGKDAAQIIARINGFTYVKTQFDYYTGELKVVETIPYSDGPRAAVNCYGSDDVREALPSCGTRTSTSRSPVTPPTHALPAPRRWHLQEGAHRGWQEVLLRRFWWRHWPYPAPGQHGRRPCLLRHDRHHGPYALRRPVRRFFLRACARRHDGSHRHGKQPHGRCHRRLRCRRRGGPQG